MAPQKLTEYELKRLENIRRNDEMMAALKIQSKATELFAAAKQQRVETKSYTVKSEKKPKMETLLVIGGPYEPEIIEQSKECYPDEKMIELVKKLQNDNKRKVTRFV